jgi:hypothetical protein
MPNVTLYLPDDLHAYAKDQDLKLSPLLQDAVRAHQDSQSPLQAKFVEELKKYRNSLDRKLDWVRQYGPDEPFTACEVCGSGMDDGEGCCQAMVDPYNAAPVALLAHYPDDLRRDSLQYWADSGYTDVALGPQ